MSGRLYKASRAEKLCPVFQTNPVPQLRFNVRRTGLTRDSAIIVAQSVGGRFIDRVPPAVAWIIAAPEI
jgi:hypothetical protein